MDLEHHYTHWNVRADLYENAQAVSGRFGTTWNSYYDHPPGYNLDHRSVDFWGLNGRGDPLPEGVGDPLVAWVVGESVNITVQWLIWFGWIWTPEDGWSPYPGWQGTHHDHVHVTFL